MSLATIRDWGRSGFLASSAALAVMASAPSPCRAVAALAASREDAGSEIIVPELTGVRIKSASPLEWSDEFEEALGSYLGKPLTQADRVKIINDIVDIFRRHGRPAVNVITPPQDITSGVLQIVVLQGKVGEIRVEGNRWFNAESIIKLIRARPGDAVDLKTTLQDLDWINRNPFRQVSVIYQRGSEPGATNLVLREVDIFPLSFSAGSNDSGTPLTSNNRVSAGVMWGNVFGADGQLNYQYSASPEMKFFKAHSVGFTQPLPWRHSVTVFGSYADVNARVPDLFTLRGYNWQTSVRYGAPLPDLSGYKHSLVAGFDFKRANNNLAFGGTKVYGAATDTAQWSMAYNAGSKDSWGGTSLQVMFSYSPGGLTPQNTTADYDQVRAGARAGYVYGKAQLNRATRLPFNVSLVNTLTYQASDSNLLASEQIGFGGYDTIRGYDTRVFNSDHGYIVSSELRAPPLSLFGLAGLEKIAGKIKDSFQLLGFVDYGAGGNKNPLPGEGKEVKLLGIGPGLRYTISPYLSLWADYGWQLLNQAEASRPYASRSHIGAVLRY